VFFFNYSNSDYNQNPKRKKKKTHNVKINKAAKGFLSLSLFLSLTPLFYLSTRYGRPRRRRRKIVWQFGEND